MARKKKEQPPELVAARERFEQWRAKRGSEEKIPAELWTLAMEVARQHGVYGTARALRLNYSDLKKRLSSGLLQPHPQATPAVDFLEFSAEEVFRPARVASGARLELRTGGGAELVLELAVAEQLDLERVLTHFFRGAP